MKKIAFLLLLAFFCRNGFTQKSTFMWPVHGKSAGENILYRPGDYIDKEANYADLIISAEENTPVVSPVTGIITTFRYVYRKTYSNSVMFGLVPSSDYVSDCNEILKSYPDKNYDPKYLTITIGIKIQNGSTAYISGLKPAKTFKTGEKISQGDLGYLYYKITQKYAPNCFLSLHKNHS